MRKPSNDNNDRYLKFRKEGCSKNHRIFRAVIAKRLYVLEIGKSGLLLLREGEITFWLTSASQSCTRRLPFFTKCFSSKSSAHFMLIFPFFSWRVTIRVFGDSLVNLYYSHLKPENQILCEVALVLLNLLFEMLIHCYFFQ